MRLRAERDLRPEQEHLALADLRLDGRGAAFEIVLAPRPAGSQRRLRVEPRDRSSRPAAPRPARAPAPGCCRRTRRPACPCRTRAGWCCRPRRAGSSRECSTSCPAAAARCRPAAPRRGDRSPAGRDDGRAPPSRRTRRSTPPSSAKRFNCGTVCLDRDAAERDRDTPPGCPRRAAGAAEAADRHRRHRVSGMPPSGNRSTSNFALRLPASSVAGIDHLELELELLEQPAQVTRRHRAAVLIPQPDAHLAAACTSRPPAARRPP